MGLVESVAALYAVLIVPLYLLLAAAFVGGLMEVFGGFRVYRRFWQIARNPTTAIGDLSRGLVHVRGKATGPTPLISPLAGTPCYLYQVTVMREEGYVSTEDGTSTTRGHWTNVAVVGRCQHFYLEDQTGKVLVYPNDAWGLPETFRAKTSGAEILESKLDTTISSRMPSFDDLCACYKPARDGKRYSFREVCLIAGHEVNVLGTCSANPRPTDGNDGNLISKGKHRSLFMISEKSDTVLETTLGHRATDQMRFGAIMATVALALAAALPIAGGYLRSAAQQHRPPVSSNAPVPLQTTPAEETPSRMRETRETQAKRLLYAPPPEYPDLAKQAGIQGTVELEVLIGTEGLVKQVKVISGSPLLSDAAIQAVSRWRYQPVAYGGRNVEVETVVDLSFTLGKH